MDNVNENINHSKGLLHFKEKSWSNWIKEVTESRVYRLPYQDMHLYGVRPEIDIFSAVICTTCGSVVKAPALQRHIELRHPEETQSFIAPKQVPVKKSRPNILRKPSKSPVPVENGVGCNSTNAQSTTVVNNTSSAIQSITAVKPEANIVTVNTKIPNLVDKPRRKSPSHNERKRTKDKDKEADGEKSSSSQEPSSSSSARTTPKQLQKRNHHHHHHHHHSNSNSNSNSNSETSKSSVRSSHSSSSVKSSSKHTGEKYPKKSATVAIWAGREEVNSIQMKCTSSNSAPTTKNISMSILENIEKILFSETDMGDSLLSTLVPNDTPEPLPESSSTPQVLTERPVAEAPAPSAAKAPVPAPATAPASAPATSAAAPFPVIPDIPCISPPILDAEMLINSISPFKIESTHQLLKVMPPSAPSFSVKVSSSKPVLILSPKDPALPAVNLNVNSESTKTVITKQIHSSNPASVLKPRAVKVPITVQMPLQEKFTNITFYKRYPKPITQSSFASSKLGGMMVYNSKRTNIVRNNFKTVICKKAKVVNTPTVVFKSRLPGSTGSKVYTAKPLGSIYNFKMPKVISVIPNVLAYPLLHPRPNILRAGVPRQGMPRYGMPCQQGPRMLAPGMKRVATSSQQNDCKRLLLTQGSVNGQCFNGKMVVHQRAPLPLSLAAKDHHALAADAPSQPAHLLEKAVPLSLHGK